MTREWRVSFGPAEVVVAAEDWLGALSAGLAALDLDLGPLARLACETAADGSAVARDPVTGIELLVEPLGDAPVVPAPEMTEAAEPLAAPAAHDEGPLPDDLVEDLFLRLGEITSAPGVASASGVALRVLLDLVPAGAGSVLIRTSSGAGLRFRAVSGPAADRLVDSVIPLDRGIAGYVCQMGVGLSIADARRDRRHDGRVDRTTGFVTRALLAVPVRPDTGGSPLGVIELLNPPRAFSDRDLEIAARVGASLGTFLQSVYAAR